MEGTTLFQQHDNFQKQTSNYQKLLQHAMNKFSKEKLNHMLKAVSRCVPYLEGSRSHDRDHPQRITSLQDLREILSDIKSSSSKRHGLQKDEEVYLIKYFDTYFDDLEYLRSLKKHFDEKIYVCLYDYFYDPSDDVEGQYDIMNRKDLEIDMSDEDKDSGLSTHSEDEDKIIERYEQHRQSGRALQKIQQTQPQEVVLDDLSDREKLSYAVKELFDLNQLWDKLFEEEYIDPTCFDEDSYHELLQLKDYVNYENVLRLIPDMFVKAHKSIELAKLWWTQANKVYTHLPAKRNSTVEFTKKAEDMEKIISDLRHQINRDEQMLLMLQKELKLLTDREKKFNELSEVCREVEEEKNDLGQKHNEVLLERDALKRTLTYTDKKSTEYLETTKKIKECDSNLVSSQYMLDFLEYKLTILQSDFDCAMQVRPDMIYFEADVNEKISTLEESLGINRAEVRQQEKRLVLLRTNCDRMRQIMRKYIKSVDLHDRHARNRLMQDHSEKADSLQSNSSQRGTVPSPPKSKKPSKTKLEIQRDLENIDSGNISRPVSIGSKHDNDFQSQEATPTMVEELQSQDSLLTGENDDVSANIQSNDEEHKTNELVRDSVHEDDMLSSSTSVTEKPKDIAKKADKGEESGQVFPTKPKKFISKPKLQQTNRSIENNDSESKVDQQAQQNTNIVKEEIPKNKNKVTSRESVKEPNHVSATKQRSNPTEPGVNKNQKSEPKVQFEYPKSKKPAPRSEMPKSKSKSLPKESRKNDAKNSASSSSEEGNLADSETSPGSTRKMDSSPDISDGSRYRQLFKNNKYHVTNDSILNRKALPTKANGKDGLKKTTKKV